jgi:hypothetical protein
VLSLYQSWQGTHSITITEYYFVIHRRKNTGRGNTEIGAMEDEGIFLVVPLHEVVVTRYVSKIR